MVRKQLIFLNWKRNAFINATRNISQEILNVIADQLPNFYSGAADLVSSTKTVLRGKDRNITFGMREFAMVAIINGVNLHEGIKITGGYFLVFSDYCKDAMRIAAINQIPTTMLFFHGNIAVVEDGPTHQSIEQINGLHMLHNFRGFRPCDGKTDRCLLSKESERGECILIATGSEVELAIRAKERLVGKVNIRVVFMPCMELFDMQVKEYYEEIQPQDVEKRILIELGDCGLAYKYIGLKGKAIDVASFG